MNSYFEDYYGQVGKIRLSLTVYIRALWNIQVLLVLIGALY